MSVHRIFFIFLMYNLESSLSGTTFLTFDCFPRFFCIREICSSMQKLSLFASLQRH